LTPSEFRAETVLDADVEQVYAFHENPANIRKITPRWQQVATVEANGQACAGEHFFFELRLFRVIPVRWEGVWLSAERPTLLQDAMVRGPFAFFEHRHSFRAIAPGRTLMSDHVTYRFGRGWLGKVFDETVGRIQFRLMFADRHARTRRYLRAEIN
jgi:ligand-binding SRPBCC domain-containing protein